MVKARAVTHGIDRTPVDSEDFDVLNKRSTHSDMQAGRRDGSRHREEAVVEGGRTVPAGIRGGSKAQGCNRPYPCGAEVWSGAVAGVKDEKKMIWRLFSL